jgi:RNA polymerase sigma-70 factor (ECF subfamily)
VAGGGAQAARRDAVRHDWPRILAPLVRMLGDVQRAEDCAQDAIVDALRAWEQHGVPEVPRAWLIRAARNRAVDVIRRESRRDVLEAEATRLGAAEEEGEMRPDDEPADDEIRAVDDDVLRLVFLCCHPALSPDTQTALCLRLLGGLTTAEIARAFLTPEATMAKRLTRAKQKIAQAAIPFAVPAADALPRRLAGAAGTIYLMFNEGYASSESDDLMRPTLIDEAIRLGRLLHGQLPSEPTTAGLLALMLLQDSRRATRTSVDGDLVLLRDQDRAAWDRDAIRQGVALVGEGLAASPDAPDAYVVQAAIAACHALAPRYEETDWAAVVSWYDVLLGIQDTPVVRLNRAVAVGERDGASAGLAEVDAVAGLAAYPLWHASRGELLQRLGRRDEALVALDAALALPVAAAVRRHLRRRRSELGA